jgi:hypothetical protein
VNRSLINRFKLVALSVALPLASLSHTQAAPVSLDFALPDVNAGGTAYEEILDYYNGGTDQYGSSGANYGISFTSTALALGQYALYPTLSNTGNEPGGGNGMIFLSGSADVMNVAAGFNTGFSFYYAAAFAGSISVYSGLNGTGTLLATLTLPAVGVQDVTEPYYGLEGWTPIGVSFSGTAESVDFSGTANYIAFADVTLNSSTPIIGSGVPETTGINICVLAGLVLAGAGWAFRKQAIVTA